MKSCRHCYAPIDNNAARCPRCGREQQGGPKLREDQPEGPGFAHEGASKFAGHLLLLIPLLCAGIGGFLGYLIADVLGAVIGALAGFVLGALAALL